MALADDISRIGHILRIEWIMIMGNVNLEKWLPTSLLSNFKCEGTVTFSLYSLVWLSLFIFRTQCVNFSNNLIYCVGTPHNHELSNIQFLWWKLLAYTSGVPSALSPLMNVCTPTWPSSWTNNGPPRSLLAIPVVFDPDVQMLSSFSLGKRYPHKTVLIMSISRYCRLSTEVVFTSMPPQPSTIALPLVICLGTRVTGKILEVKMIWVTVLRTAMLLAKVVALNPSWILKKLVFNYLISLLKFKLHSLRWWHIIRSSICQVSTTNIYTRIIL